jgi:thiol-disulfide isomerase/thioredoxin
MNNWRIGTTRICALLWMALFLVVLVQCDSAAPSTNPVQSIDLAALDKMMKAENFSGLIVAMASWCPPCREELPELTKLHQKYHDQGIQIVAVSLDADGPAAVQPLINQLKIPFPVYWVGTKAIEPLSIRGVPSLFVINKGTLLEKLPGMQSKRILENKIKKLLP